ncbi:MAG: hypothetical protein KDB48_10460 [Solirubrobacterales bacterium]|nr:hypothetical protein [Solirubrobacterales bacterium]HMT04797.1 hypothetical protein [Solirubrobacterales bacterium]
MSEVDDLRARVQELERKVDLLFSHTGAVDRESVAVDAPQVSAEVELLLNAGEHKKAAKLYRKETGAGVRETMAALTPIVERNRDRV